MKTIGLIGGMGPASTLLYYETLCALTRSRLGGNASAPVLIHALDFAAMQSLQQAGAWDEIADILLSSGQALAAAGADFICLATNTMHKSAGALETQLDVPFLHIADMTAGRLRSDRRTCPALIGTAYTMNEDFLSRRISKIAGADVIVPEAEDRAMLQRVIFSDLVKGIVTDQTRRDFISLATRLKADGADSLILGCTEIGLVLNAENCPLPVYDTARIHCEEAVALALA